MASMSESLLEQLKELEELFTVDRDKLKQIVVHFVKELQKGESFWYSTSSNKTDRSIAADSCSSRRPKGLSVEGGNIVSALSYSFNFGFACYIPTIQLTKVSRCSCCVLPADECHLGHGLPDRQ